MCTATVKYELGTYSGTVHVVYEEGVDDDSVILALAKANLRRRAGPLPAGPMYESWKIVDRDHDELCPTE